MELEDILTGSRKDVGHDLGRRTMVSYLTDPDPSARKLSIVPPVIQRAVLPGETESTHFSVDGAVGRLTAKLLPKVEGIRIESIQTQRVTHRPFNPEIDGPLPHGVRPPQFVVEREFVESVGPGVGIEVTGLEIIGRIDFGASAPTGWMTSTALVLETASGVVAAIPVNLFCGLPQIVVLGQPIEAQIGRSTRFSARVALPSGAPPVALTLDAADGPVTVPPKPVAVSGAVHAVVELNLLLSVAARPGLMEAHLTVDGFAGEEFRVPFKIRAVLPPPPPDPVDPPANFAAINDLWRAHRAEKGPFGHPLAKAERIGNVFLRKFAGGIIKSINAQASVADRQYVRVQLAGYTCISKTVNSPFGNDEPYFIVGAAASNGSVTRLFGPYDVEYDGTEQTISFELAGRELALVPPVTLVLIGFEHDNGNPREAEEKARVIISGIPSKLTSVTDPSSAEVDSHVVAQWLRDLGIGSIFEAVTAILGIGDDPIGRDVKPVYDEIPALIDRRQYPIIGKFQSEFPYTHILGIGGSNGSYILYFKVDLVTDSDPLPLSSIHDPGEAIFAAALK